MNVSFTPRLWEFDSCDMELLSDYNFITSKKNASSLTLPNRAVFSKYFDLFLPQDYNKFRTDRSIEFK